MIGAVRLLVATILGIFVCSVSKADSLPRNWGTIDRGGYCPIEEYADLSEGAKAVINLAKNKRFAEAKARVDSEIKKSPKDYTLRLLRATIPLNDVQRNEIFNESRKGFIATAYQAAQFECFVLLRNGWTPKQWGPIPVGSYGTYLENMGRIQVGKVDLPKGLKWLHLYKANTFSRGNENGVSPLERQEAEAGYKEFPNSVGAQMIYAISLMHGNLGATWIRNGKAEYTPPDRWTKYQYEKALEISRDVVKRHPNYRLPLIRLGYVCYKLGMQKQSKVLLAESLNYYRKYLEHQGVDLMIEKNEPLVRKDIKDITERLEKGFKK